MMGPCPRSAVTSIKRNRSFGSFFNIGERFYTSALALMDAGTD